jgi:hypothetical protein
MNITDLLSILNDDLTFGKRIENEKRLKNKQVWHHIESQS